MGSSEPVWAFHVKEEEQSARIQQERGAIDEEGFKLVAGELSREE